MNGNGNGENWDEARPATPTYDDCCGNSCNPCVFDVHKRLLEEWEARKARGSGNKVIPEENFLNPLTYKTFVVRDVIRLGEEFVRIQLDCSNKVDADSRLSLNPGQHVLLSLDNKKSRPYTPISWTRDSFELLVRIYPYGILSNRLAHMKVAESIRVRGPYGDFVYQSNTWKTVFGFCMGSGIAAIYPVARAIVEDEKDETRFHIVAGFREITGIPLKNELRRLSDYWNVQCTFRVSNVRSGSFDVSIPGTKIESGRLDEAAIQQILGENHRPLETLVLICGSPEFNKSVSRWVKDRGFSSCHVFE